MLISPGVCRRAVPLAIALLHVSNPDMTALDTLSRLSHDADSEVAQSAVLSLGGSLPLTYSCPTQFSRTMQQNDKDEASSSTVGDLGFCASGGSQHNAAFANIWTSY